MSSILSVLSRIAIIKLYIDKIYLEYKNLRDGSVSLIAYCVAKRYRVDH